MAASDKGEEAAKLVKKANKYLSPSILDLRLKPDWEAAAPLLDRAAVLYKVRIFSPGCACIPLPSSGRIRIHHFHKIALSVAAWQ